jgi:hypothetical protein
MVELTGASTVQGCAGMDVDIAGAPAADAGADGRGRNHNGSASILNHQMPTAAGCRGIQDGFAIEVLANRSASLQSAVERHRCAAVHLHLGSGAPVHSAVDHRRLMSNHAFYVASACVVPGNGERSVVEGICRRAGGESDHSHELSGSEVDAGATRAAAGANGGVVGAGTVPSGVRTVGLIDPRVGRPPGPASVGRGAGGVSIPGEVARGEDRKWTDRELDVVESPQVVRR